MQFVTMLLYFINTIHLCVKICVAAVHVLIRNKEVVMHYMFFFFKFQNQTLYSKNKFSQDQFDWKITKINFLFLKRKIKLAISAICQSATE